MGLISTYQNAIRKILLEYETQEKVVVFKGYDPRVFLELRDLVYRCPIDENGRLIKDQIEEDQKVIYKELIAPSETKFLLFEQLSYAIDKGYEPIKENIVIVEDNLRALFPYALSEQLEQELEFESEVILKAPLNSYAQVLEFGQGSFVKYVTHPEGLQVRPLFIGSVELAKADMEDCPRLVPLEPDTTSLDLVLDEFLVSDSPPVICVELSEHDPQFSHTSRLLGLMNRQFIASGGRIVILDIETPQEEVQHPELLQDLLTRYWGEGAKFRTINVYKNPEGSSQVISVGQDVLVDQLLIQCENARQGKEHRDIFITAPTGAGKSLLFQLPAFHLAEHGRVTIVVSPLIALMKDQVQAIIRDRGFSKVAYLNSELSLVDRERVIEQVKEGAIDMVYLSPELLLSYDISHFIGERSLGLVIVDEAHLVTTWGRDFRVDYWFLGNHLRKIRKYGEQSFVVMACTATAVFGGTNDMAFDCMDSLYLKNPIYYIGSVKRSDIHFVIGREDSPAKGYDKFKLGQTVKFCKDILSRTSLKTLVYAPYVKQISTINDSLEDGEKALTCQYYGKLDSSTKSHYFDEYLHGSRRLMLATKAFGMGVDIRDIQVVYHHAPSGQLADYVQEIGRLARDPGLEGYAAINFSDRDVRYTNVLHGISSVKPWEIRGVLEKLAKHYARDKEKNLLVSVDDFANIFPDTMDLGQKVMTALMMIEKDYLIKSRFNVIIARPKKLFTKVFAKLDMKLASSFLQQYSFAVNEIKYQAGGATKGYRYVEIDLDTLWKRRFREISFPLLKSKFYKRELFGDHAAHVVPQFKFTFKPLASHSALGVRFKDFLNLVFRFFREQRSFFTEEDLVSFLCRNGFELRKAQGIAQRVLAMYGSARESAYKLFDVDAFLQRRHIANSGRVEYNVFGNRHAGEFQTISNFFDKIFLNDSEEYVRYASRESGADEKIMRLGYLLEMAEVCLFEITGGEAPMIFIRINDPRRVMLDSRKNDYTNILLEDVHRRHKVSVDIFKHFFLREMEDKERWDFIEDYFLGKDVDELLDEYPGREADRGGDVISHLPTVATSFDPVPVRPGNNTDAFLESTPIRKKLYGRKDLLTLSQKGKRKTMTVEQWVKEDPVLLAESMDEHDAFIDKESYRVLMSIVSQHESYMRKKKGFELPVKISDNSELKPAKTHFLTDPIKFYKWFSMNGDKLVLKLEERIQIFQEVFNRDASSLLPEHLRILKPRK